MADDGTMNTPIHQPQDDVDLGEQMARNLEA
jgi:hypothetical protein